MHPSIRLLRQPAIKFLGKRAWPSTPHAPHAHPAAPAEIKKSFSEFAKKLEASSSSETSPKSTRKEVFEEFWEAPSWVRQPRYKELQDAEIDAVLSGGASLR